jgi:aspartyl-tRNA(Asn)/glutamyl-tRNA(Gln) amidotransferase subunit B
MTHLVGVVGLEIHVQLSRKLFTRPAPGRSVTGYCLGWPGTLPVLQPEPIHDALRLSLALDCTIASRSSFVRKHYHYPDLPKGYQITQGAEPLATAGKLVLSQTMVPVDRVHVEEDAARIKQVEGGAWVEHDRAGMGLAEVVTAPTLRSGAEAAEAFRALHRLVVTLGISEGRMERGELRCDANVSLEGSARCEVKNLNSFRFVREAVDAELARHAEMIDRGEPVRSETRSWDRQRRRTERMRDKESSPDYRYLPEPDLPPLMVPRRFHQELRATLPELPHHRRARWLGLGLRDEQIQVLLDQPDLATRVDEASAGEPDADDLVREAVRLLAGVGLGLLREQPGLRDAWTPSALRELCRLRNEERISSRQQAAWLGRLGEEDVSALFEREGPIRDPDVIRASLDRARSAHPDAWSRLLAGQHRLQAFFIGQVMADTQGRADPGTVRHLLPGTFDCPPNED